ncbi:MAG: pyruvate dehydrogenase complex dihydrolipoamide acetyltransferase [Paracoccaceae bacterium]
MPINITMPALSPTMEEGNLAKWLIKEGDTIASGDIIAEIETDKATMEVEAVDEGVVGKIVVPEGTEAVKVNAVIAVLLEDGESASDIGDAATPAPAAAPPTATPPAAEAATLSAAPAPAVTAPASGVATGGGARVFASPLARRIAADKGIDLTQVTGTGPKGRIVKADVEDFSPATAAVAAAPAPSAAPAPAASAMAAGPSTEAVRKMYEDRAYEEVPLDGMRKTIAARLTEAKQSIPHFYLRRDIELDTLLDVRKTFNAKLEKSGTKLSVNDFIIKACAMALQRVPGANAVWAGDRVLQFKAADVAVAVAIEGGLFTPVLRDANAKGLAELSAEMKDLAGRARERKLAPHEYQGGAFAISNLGMFGIDNFDAVINPPHASILAVGAGVQKPVVRDGVLAVATVMSVTLSVDHRVIDGALGAQFLDVIKANLEDPMMMLV